MRRIFVVLPVSTEKWVKETKECVSKVISDATEVHVTNLPGAPTSIETYYDSAKVASLVVDAIVKAEMEGYNAAVIGCFEDPGLDASRELVSIPVLGIGETSIIIASILGKRIAIISTGRNSRAVYERKMIEMGLYRKLAYSCGIELPVLKLDEDRETVIKLLVDEAENAIKNFGAEIIVLGCGGMIGLHDKLQEILKVPVIDPLLSTIKVAELIVDLKLTHSKAWIYNIPRHKWLQFKGSHLTYR